MKRIVLVLIAALCALSALPAHAERIVLEPEPLAIYGVVYNQMPGLSDKLLAKAKDAKTVDIVINSPGGSVLHGNLFINAMEMVKARGTKIRCVVTNLAASMAFQILAHCDERYAFRYSLLLWHPVRVQGNMLLTPKGAYDLARSLYRIENILVEDLRGRMNGISKDEFFFHYYQESLLTTVEVRALTKNFITVVDDVGGLDALTELKGEAPQWDDEASAGEVWYVLPTHLRK